MKVKALDYSIYIDGKKVGTMPRPSFKGVKNFVYGQTHSIGRDENYRDHKVEVRDDNQQVVATCYAVESWNHDIRLVPGPQCYESHLNRYWNSTASKRPGTQNWHLEWARGDWDFKR